MIGEMDGGKKKGWTEGKTRWRDGGRGKGEERK